MRGKPTNSKRFREVWESSDSLQEVSRRLKIKPESASQRATNLRKLGIKLKHMPRAKAIDMDELIAIANRSN